jgi:hypothetical protein
MLLVTRHLQTTRWTGKALRAMQLSYSTGLLPGGQVSKTQLLHLLLKQNPQPSCRWLKKLCLLHALFRFSTSNFHLTKSQSIVATCRLLG